MDLEKDMAMLKNIARVGTVSSVDADSRTARVMFADKGGMVSGPLKVIQNPPFIPARGTVQETEAKGGGTGESAYETHSHDVKISPWLPDVGHLVLCLYLPNSDSDGFIIGRI